MQPAILLVDDDEDILDYLERTLKVQYRIYRTDSADEAIKLLNTTSVQLIISDVMMPNIDGLEFCKIVKSKPSISHIPVILLTAKNTLQAKIAGLEVNADAYIEKPFSREHLLAQISSLIANREIILDHIAGSPLAHMKMTHSTEDRVFLDLLTEIVSSHIEDGELDVQKLASLLNMTRITLHRKIKAFSKYTPNELINMIKLQKAAEFLSSGEYKVYEVALMTGYKSQSNFARDFNRQFKISPTEFVESLKKK